MPRSVQMSFKLNEINANEELVSLAIPLDAIKPLAIDLKNDLCLIEIKNHGLIPVVISDKKILKLRDKIFTVGAPASVVPIEAEGNVSLPSITFSDDDGERVMASMPAFGGSSGSPVFDEKGEVVGLITEANQHYQKIAFFTSAKFIQTFLKGNLNK